MLKIRFALSVAAASALLVGGADAVHAPITLRPALATEPVGGDADDPAVWVARDDPARSLILGTDKGGALYVFGMDGKIRQTISGIERPNNVDVEYGLSLGGKRTDIAVLTERQTSRLRVFRINPDSRTLTDVSSPETSVFVGEPGERAAPMGIGMYRRPKDGTVFALVSRKEGPPEGRLWQYRLEDDGTGKVRAVKVREFGGSTLGGEIESVAVDDALGCVYYAEEKAGIHKWRADPDAPDAGRELAFFGRDGFAGDREGIAVYPRRDGTGYLVCTDQLPDSSEYHLYRREGEPGEPNDHRLLGVVRGGADSTDGIEAVSASLGPSFPTGALIVMNSRGHNFLLFRWDEVVREKDRTPYGSGEPPER